MLVDERVAPKASWEFDAGGWECPLSLCRWGVGWACGVGWGVAGASTASTKISYSSKDHAPGGTFQLYGLPGGTRSAAQPVLASRPRCHLLPPCSAPSRHRHPDPQHHHPAPVPGRHPLRDCAPGGRAALAALQPCQCRARSRQPLLGLVHRLLPAGSCAHAPGRLSRRPAAPRRPPAWWPWTASGCAPATAPACASASCSAPSTWWVGRAGWAAPAPTGVAIAGVGRPRLPCPACLRTPACPRGAVSCALTPHHAPSRAPPPGARHPLCVPRGPHQGHRHGGGHRDGHGHQRCRRPAARLGLTPGCRQAAGLCSQPRHDSGAWAPSRGRQGMEYCEVRPAQCAAAVQCCQTALEACVGGRLTTLKPSSSTSRPCIMTQPASEHSWAYKAIPHRLTTHAQLTSLGACTPACTMARDPTACSLGFARRLLDAGLKPCAVLFGTINAPLCFAASAGAFT